VRTVLVYLRDASGRPIPPAMLSADWGGARLAFVVTRAKLVIGQTLDWTVDVTDGLAPSLIFDRGRTSEVPWRRLLIERGEPASVSLVQRQVESDARQVVVIESVEVDPVLDEVAIVVDLSSLVGSIEASLIDHATGLAVKGVPMIVSDREVHHWLSADSDEQGQLRKDWVNPGIVHVSIRATGFVAIERDLEVRAGSVVNLGTLQLDPGVVLSGVLKRPDGSRPTSGHILYCWPEVREGDGRRDVTAFMISDAGEFRLDSMDREVYLVGECVTVENAFFGSFQHSWETHTQRCFVASASRVFARLDATAGSLEDLSIVVK
jgi:hypothetical protein